jgi:transcriptional regulator with PAS, ATPase and Fis domain
MTENIMNNIRKTILNNALQQNNGNKSKAAKYLGISRYKFIREQKKIEISEV